MDEFIQKYPVVTIESIRWGDMDAFAHVNNTVYFRYFEQARLDYFSKTDVMEYMQREGIGPILAETRCRFKAPLKWPDRIHIGARVAEYDDGQLQMEYAIWSETYQREAAEGGGRIVFVDYQTGKKVTVPTAIMDAITALEPALNKQE